MLVTGWFLNGLDTNNTRQPASVCQSSTKGTHNKRHIYKYTCICCHYGWCWDNMWGYLLRKKGPIQHLWISAGKIHLKWFTIVTVSVRPEVSLALAARDDPLWCFSNTTAPLSSTAGTYLDTNILLIRRRTHASHLPHQNTPTVPIDN